MTMVVTDTTPVKFVGQAVVEATFLAALAGRGSPALGEAALVYDYCAARGLAADFLVGMFQMESRCGTDPAAICVAPPTPTHSWGNTSEPSYGSPGTGDPPVRGRFTVYADWYDGGISTVARFFEHPPYDGKVTVREIIETWAPPSENDTEHYIAQVVETMNTLRATSENGGTVVSIPKPPVLTSPRSPNYGYNAPREVKLVVLHITEGSGASALSWLTNPSSGASSNFLIMEDGTIHELVPPDESAWANGAVNKPDMSNPIIAECINSGRNPNCISVSIEHAGYSSWGGGGSLNAIQWGMSAWLTAWLCQEYGLPPTPTTIIGHYQIDSVNRSGCPGFSYYEWVRYYTIVPFVLRQEGDDVKLPPEGTAVQFVAPNGNTVSVINWGGVATQIKGVNYADLGAHVVGDDGKTEYNRSLIDGVMQEFVVVESDETE